MKSRKNLVVAIAAIALVAIGLQSCGQPAVVSESGETTEFSWPGDQWPLSTPEAEGIDPAAIDSLVEALKKGRYGLVDHFLLIRHGRVVADHHFERDYVPIAAQYDPANHQYNYDHPDWHPYYRDTELHTLQSVTKSVTSAALGIAVDEGLIDGVEVPAMSFFEAYKPDCQTPGKRP